MENTVIERIFKHSKEGTLQILKERMDAIMTGDVDLFKIKKLEAPNTDDEAEVTQTASAPKKIEKSKPGTVPMETVKQFRFLLPMPKIKLTNCIMKCILNYLSVEQREIFQTERAAHRRGKEEKLWNPETNQDTLAFKYPTDVHSYIGINERNIDEYFFKRYGRVEDSYILNIDIVDSKFVPTAYAHPLGVFPDIDDEIGDENDVLDDGTDVNYGEEMHLA